MQPCGAAALPPALPVPTPRPCLQLEGAREVHKHELRLRMDAAIGRAPPLQDGELQVSARAPDCRCGPA